MAHESRHTRILVKRYEDQYFNQVPGIASGVEIRSIYALRTTRFSPIPRDVAPSARGPLGSSPGLRYPTISERRMIHRR